MMPPTTAETAIPMTLILSNDDVEKVLTMRDCIAVMEEAYVELAEGRGVSRTRSDCFAPTARAEEIDQAGFRALAEAWRKGAG